MQVYLDNAASTPLIPEVIEVMTQTMLSCHGNPSSIHKPGREARSLIEKSRKTVAQHLNCSLGEIFFTSGGTESNNMALKSAVCALKAKHIVSTEIEHKCVLNSIKSLNKNAQVKVHLVDIDYRGEINYEHLNQILSSLKDEKVLVSIMHANNEIGTINDLKRIGLICRENGAYFHSDTIQTIAHIPIDIQEIEIDFLSASAHKFHGPKGIGFVYINGDIHVDPYIDGGGQERNMRGGTENIYGIVGLGCALEIAINELEVHKNHIIKIRNYFKEGLIDLYPNISFNGCQEDGNHLYTILNVLFPPSPKSSLLNMSLDMAGISASGGSACSSGAESRSYVIQAIDKPADHTAIRFSFSHLNTFEEIDYVLQKISEIIPVTEEV